MDPGLHGNRDDAGGEVFAPLSPLEAVKRSDDVGRCPLADRGGVT